MTKVIQVTTSKPGKDSKFRDNTMVGSYKICPRSYQLRHILGWRSEGTSHPLIFGLSWHSAMDAVWSLAKQFKNDPTSLRKVAILKFLDMWEKQGMPTELSIEDVEKLGARTPGTAEEMLDNYISTRWKMMQECELIACEQPFAVPVPELDDIWYVGRLDKVIKFNEQTLVVEHKTTTEYKKDGGFRSTYIESWYSDSQVKGYQFGGGLFFGVEQVWVDAALVHKQVHNAFRLVPVAHQFPLIQEWLGDLLEWLTRIEQDTAKGYFPKNENSCVGKYGPCPFLDICRTTPDPTKLSEPPAGYILERWQPFELLGLNKIIKDT